MESSQNAKGLTIRIKIQTGNLGLTEILLFYCTSKMLSKDTLNESKSTNIYELNLWSEEDLIFEENILVLSISIKQFT